MVPLEPPLDLPLQTTHCLPLVEYVYTNIQAQLTHVICYIICNGI